MKVKNAYSPFQFHKEYLERKFRNIFIFSYLCDDSSNWKLIDKMHSINPKGSKKNWVQNVKT